MDAWKWAAVIVVGWGFGSAIVGVFTGRFIADWRDYCAEYAQREYVNREIARLEREVQP